MQGRFVEAISEFRKCRAIAPKDPEGIWGLAWAYAKVGKRNEAQEGIDELRELPKQGIAVSGGMSEIYAGLGENENALASLEKAYEDGDFGLINLKVNPVFDSLRNDSRYHELLRKTGLE